MTYLQVHWYFFSACLSCSWFSLVYLSIQLLYFWYRIYFLYFLFVDILILFKCHFLFFVPLFVSFSSFSMLKTVVLKALVSKSKAYISSVMFSGGLFCLFSHFFVCLVPFCINLGHLSQYLLTESIMKEWPSLISSVEEFKVFSVLFCVCIYVALCMCFPPNFPVYLAALKCLNFSRSFIHANFWGLSCSSLVPRCMKVCSLLAVFISHAYSFLVIFLACDLR